MALPPDRLDRFARQIVIPEIGGAGQAALAARQVVLAGLGGIGSPVLQYLAGAGIGRLTLIDDGALELSNLPRQTLYRAGDIGRPKAELAAEWVRGFDPATAVMPLVARIDPTNAPALFAGADLVIDGTDSFAARLAISDACVSVGMPLLSAAVGRFQGQVGAFRGHLPGEPCYRCFVGDAFDGDDCDSCAQDGMLGAMAGWAGSFAALHAVKVLLEGVSALGAPQWGRVHLLDGIEPSLRSFAIAKDPACRGCGSGA